MLNANIQVILQKSNINLNLRCWISKLIGAFGTWDILFSKLSTLQGKNVDFIRFDF